jgi:Zn-dependent M28 family amino/carboxypeptidase
MQRATTILKADVDSLSLPEGRMVGSDGHEIAKRFILGRFEEMGLTPYEAASFCLSYSDAGQDFVNLVGVMRAKRTVGSPILIGAHYDSVIAAPSADDNAAAIAVALAAASLLRSRPIERDVVIAMMV